MEFVTVPLWDFCPVADAVARFPDLEHFLLIMFQPAAFVDVVIETEVHVDVLPS